MEKIIYFEGDCSEYSYALEHNHKLLRHLKYEEERKETEKIIVRMKPKKPSVYLNEKGNLVFYIPYCKPLKKDIDSPKIQIHKSLVLTKDGKFYIVKNGKVKRNKLNIDYIYYYISKKMTWEYNKITEISCILLNFLKEHFKIDLTGFRTVSQRQINFYVKYFDKLPKSIKKKVYESKNLETIRRIHYIGFKDPNVIMQILEEAKNGYDFTTFAKASRYYLKMYKKVYEGTNVNYEKAFVNRLYKRDEIKNYFRGLNIHLFLAQKNKRICKDLPNKIVYMPAKKLSEFIGDTVTNDINIINYMEYDYDKEIKIDGQKVKNLTFYLPKNSIELNQLGKDMNNCVASYSFNIKRKESLIIYAKEDEKYIACIEVDKNNKVLQCLAPSNQNVPDDQLANIYEFFEQNNFEYVEEELKRNEIFIDLPF